MKKWNLNYKIRLTLTERGWNHLKRVDSVAEAYLIEKIEDVRIVELPAWEAIINFGNVDGRIDTYMSMWVELEHI